MSQASIPDEPIEKVTPPTKRPYHAPELQVLGSMADLTRTNAAGPKFDGGGGANIYAS